MKPRKIALLSAIAILLCIFIVQLVNSSQGSIREMKLSAKPDTILIAQSGSSVALTQVDGAWVVGDQKYPADASAVTDMINAIVDVKALDTVAKANNDATLARYGLDAGHVIAVKASKGGKDLRTILVGKDAPTYSQTYATLNGGKSIYLVSGSLHGIFGKTIDALRSTVVYNVKSDDIVKVSVSSPEGDWALAKGGTPPAWSLAPATLGTSPGLAARSVIDSAKAASWVQSLNQLNVDSWLPDNALLPNTRPTTVTIALNDREITVNVYASGSGKNLKYLCSSNVTPYKFTLGAYGVSLFTKRLSDLEK